MPRYQWNNPQEWLLQKTQQHAAANDTAELLAIINELIVVTDADTIQNIFQTEMDWDGYFTDLDKPEEGKR